MSRRKTLSDECYEAARYPKRQGGERRGVIVLDRKHPLHLCITPTDPRMRRWNRWGSRSLLSNPSPRPCRPRAALQPEHPHEESYGLGSADDRTRDGTPHAGRSHSKRGTYDARIRTALYSDAEVYRLYGFVGYGEATPYANVLLYSGVIFGDAHRASP
jgi:hypothetical protein